MTPNPLYPNGEFGFFFHGDKGHVDGEGSMISFDWWTGAAKPDLGEQMRFTVYGEILKENPLGIPGGDGIYRSGAKLTWGKFVNQYMFAIGAPDGSWYWTN